MRIVIIIGLGLLTLFACKKGKADFTLMGTLMDQTFNTKHSNAKVLLYEKVAGSAQTNLLGEMTTNSSGEYFFTFPRNQAESYILIAEKDNYFDLEETITFSELTIEENNIRNFSATALSWVKLRFINQSPLPSDVLSYIKQNGKSDCSICCPDDEVLLNGAIDTSIYCANDGNTLYSYYYFVSGTSNQGTKSTTTVAFDTTEILLNY